MELILFIAIGLLIGLLAEKVLKKKRLGLAACIITALIGSVLGGWTVENLGFTSLEYQTFLSLATSFVGGIVMVGLGYLFKLNN